MEPARPPLPTWTNLPFQAAPSGIITSILISESAVGRLVTVRSQAWPDFRATVLAEVTWACGRLALARSAQAVSARAASGAASARTAPPASRIDFMVSALLRNGAGVGLAGLLR